GLRLGQGSGAWGGRGGRRRRTPPPRSGRGIDVEEYEARRLPLPGLREVLVRRLGRRGWRSRAAGRAPLGIAVHLEMLLQHPAKLGVLRGDVGELLERGERLLDLPDLLHALRVFDEVLLRFGDEALRRVQFGELQVGVCRPGALRSTLLHIAIALL